MEDVIEGRIEGREKGRMEGRREERRKDRRKGGMEERRAGVVLQMLLPVSHKTFCSHI